MPKYVTYVGKQPQLQNFEDNVYRSTLLIVDDAPQNSNELQGTITSGTSVTLTDSGTYSGNELNIKLNGIDLVPLRDYNYVGSGSAKTQVSFTFDLIGTRSHPDVVEFYKENN